MATRRGSRNAFNSNRGKRRMLVARDAHRLDRDVGDPDDNYDDHGFHCNCGGCEQPTIRRRR